MNKVTKLNLNQVCNCHDNLLIIIDECSHDICDFTDAIRSIASYLDQIDSIQYVRHSRTAAILGLTEDSPINFDEYIVNTYKDDNGEMHYIYLKNLVDMMNHPSKYEPEKIKAAIPAARDEMEILMLKGMIRHELKCINTILSMDSELQSVLAELKI